MASWLTCLLTATGLWLAASAGPAVAADPMTPEAFRDLYRAEAAQWGALIRKIGLKLD